MTRVLAITCALLALALAAVAFVAYDRGQQIAKIELARDAKFTSYAASLDRATEVIKAQTARSATDHGVITQLRQRLSDAAGVEQNVRHLAALADARAARANAERDAALATLQKTRRDLYATDPDSAAWARLAMPAPLGVQLRDQWTEAAQRGLRPPAH